jgi:hypothetical protein
MSDKSIYSKVWLYIAMGLPAEMVPWYGKINEFSFSGDFSTISIFPLPVLFVYPSCSNFWRCS